MASQGELEISSVAGQAPSLDRHHSSSPGLVEESTKCSQRCRSPPPRTQYSKFTDASNIGWGTHLEQNSIKGLGSDLEKSLHINILELKAVFLALKNLKSQCQNQTVLVATDNSTVVAYINKQDSLSRNVHPTVENHELVSLIQNITLCQTHPRVCQCDHRFPDFQIDSNSTREWSLHPQVFKNICKMWFTPQVDLFATHLKHKLPLYVSPVPDQQAWNIDALNINWSDLVAYAYPLTALLLKVVQKVCQCNCLLILVAPGWLGMPWFWDLVQLSIEIPLQLPASPTPLKQSSNQVFHNNPQYLNLHAWCLGVSNSKNKASSISSRRSTECVTSDYSCLNNHSG